MLLAIDVGNTHTVLGLYEGEHLAHMWRVATNKAHTADELRIKLRGLLQAADLPHDAVGGAALASVFAPKLCEKPAFAYLAVALDVIFAVVSIVEFTSFSNLGHDAMLFGIAAALSIVGAAISVAGVKSKLSPMATAAATAVVMVLAVAFARYCFYAASIL